MIKDKSIYIKNIYYMLTYAFEALRQNNYEEIEKEDFENIQNLFAGILSKGISAQLKRGLHREYIEVYEDLPVLRGKLDFNGTIKHRVERKQVLSCAHDELSENNLLNQILKTTAYMLVNHANTAKKYKIELKKEMLFFSGVELVNPSFIRWNALKYERGNKSYEMLMNVCYFVLNGLIYSDERGEYRVASFLDEQKMSRLYEKFVLNYYAYHYRGRLSVCANQFKWKAEDGVIDFLPDMHSDITLKHGGKTLIIDTKYYTRTMQTDYRSNKKTFHSHNLYQIFAYVKNADGGRNVAGMLLYAKTDEDITPDSAFTIDGNRYFVKTLDLNKPFAEISASLDKIVKDYFYI